MQCKTGMSQLPQITNRDDRLILLFECECEVSDGCVTAMAAGDRNREAGVKFRFQWEKINYILHAVRKLSLRFPGDDRFSSLLNVDIRFTGIQGGNFKERKSKHGLGFNVCE